MDKSLLDTDTLSAINKAFDRDLFATADRYLATFGYFTFSSVTVMEIVRGYFLAGRLERLAEFLASLESHEVLSCTLRPRKSPERSTPNCYALASRSEGPIR